MAAVVTRHAVADIITVIIAVAAAAVSKILAAVRFRFAASRLRFAASQLLAAAVKRSASLAAAAALPTVAVLALVTTPVARTVARASIKAASWFRLRALLACSSLLKASRTRDSSSKASSLALLVLLSKRRKVLLKLRRPLQLRRLLPLPHRQLPSC